MISPPSADPWLAVDKLQHFLFCAAVASLAYLAARAHPSTAPWRLAVGAGAAFLTGATKEVGDATGLWPGVASLRDGGADAAGAVVALAALAYVDATSPATLDGVAPRARGVGGGGGGDEGVRL